MRVRCCTKRNGVTFTMFAGWNSQHRCKYRRPESECYIDFSVCQIRDCNNRLPVNRHYSRNKLQTLIIIVKISHVLPFPKGKNDDDDDDDVLPFFQRSGSFLFSSLSFFAFDSKKRGTGINIRGRRKKRRKILTRKMARIS